jgi:hypothetical protein
MEYLQWEYTLKSNRIYDSKIFEQKHCKLTQISSSLVLTASTNIWPVLGHFPNLVREKGTLHTSLSNQIHAIQLVK